MAANRSMEEADGREKRSPVGPDLGNWDEKWEWSGTESKKLVGGGAVTKEKRN